MYVCIVATRCHILWQKCTTLDFGWGSALGPIGEVAAYPKTPQLDLTDPTSQMIRPHGM